MPEPGSGATRDSGAQRAPAASGSRAPGRRGLPEVRWSRVLGGLLMAYVVGIAGAAAIRGLGWWEHGAAWERWLLREAHRTVSPALDAIFLVLPLFGTNYTLVPVIALAALWLWRPPGAWGTLLLAVAGAGIAAVAVQAVGQFVLGGTAPAMLAAVLALAGGAAAAGFDRRRRDRPARPGLAAHLVVVQLGSWVLNPALKFSVPRPRPELFEQRGQHAFPAYPSGHSIAITAVGLTAALLLARAGHGRWVWPLYAVVFLLVSCSRIYLSVHWPTDVIGGTFVGLVWMAAVLAAFRPARPAPAAPPDPG